jgi:hypothetical protein
LGLGVFILIMSPLVIFDIKHDFVLFDAFNKFIFQKEGNINLSAVLK